MHVVERGVGIPLVLIHGFGVDHRSLLPLDPVIEAVGGWRRVYLDLPGTEHTPIGDVASAEDVVVAVEREIERLVGDEPLAVLGNSFGGMVARRVAHDLRRQVLGLALVAPLIVAEHARRDVPVQTVIVEDAGVLAELGAVRDFYAEIAVVHTRENARAFVEYVYPGLRSVDESALALIAQRYGLDAEPEDASPEPFVQPTLFITGRQDQIVGYRDAWARLEHYPRATFATLDTAGHNAHMDQPGLTTALVADWLHRMRAG